MMEDKEHTKRLFQEARLRHRLEIRSREVEDVLDRHAVPAQVAGGRAGARRVTFDLQASLAAGKDLLLGLKDELAAALGVRELQFGRENGRFRLVTEPSEDVPVALLDLLPDLTDVAPLTAVLGMLADGAPLLLDLKQEDMRHVLIAGGPAAGKSALLQTIGLSLAWFNRQSQLQLMVVHCGDNGRLAPFDYLPHMLTPLPVDLEEIASLLGFLVEEIALREAEAVQQPALVVLLDDLDKLLVAGGGPFFERLAPIVQRGADVGIYVVATAADPAQIDELILAHFPVRLVGQVADEMAADLGAGMTGTQAAHLLGRGDFLAIAGDQLHRFQAAYLDAYDYHWCLQSLHRARSQVLLAQPLAERASLDVQVIGALAPDDERPFTFNGDRVDLVSAAETPPVATEPVVAPEDDKDGEEPEGVGDIDLSPNGWPSAKQPRPAYKSAADASQGGPQAKRPLAEPALTDDVDQRDESVAADRPAEQRPRRVFRRGGRPDSEAESAGRPQQKRVTAPKPKAPPPPFDDMNQDTAVDDEMYLFFDDDDEAFDAWFADEEGGAS